MLSVLRGLMEVRSSVVAACMGEREVQWCRWLTRPGPQVWVGRVPPQCTAGWGWSGGGGAVWWRRA